MCDGMSRVQTKEALLQSDACTVPEARVHDADERCIDAEGRVCSAMRRLTWLPGGSSPAERRIIGAELRSARAERRCMAAEDVCTAAEGLCTSADGPCTRAKRLITNAGGAGRPAP